MKFKLITHLNVNLGLSDGEGNNLVYSITLDDGAGAEALVHGAASTNQSTNSALRSCNTDNATLQFTVASTEIDNIANTEDDYTDTVTLTVTPV